MIKRCGQIKIIDFGYSTILGTQDQLIDSFSGTPVYLAPEIVGQSPFDGMVVIPRQKGRHLGPGCYVLQVARKGVSLQNEEEQEK
jgi:serine/threonine protein kinase